MAEVAQETNNFMSQFHFFLLINLAEKKNPDQRN